MQDTRWTLTPETSLTLRLSTDSASHCVTARLASDIIQALKTSTTRAYQTRFLSVLSSFNLTQHVNFPTHSKKHILDLVITSADSSLTPSLSTCSRTVTLVLSLMNTLLSLTKYMLSLNLAIIIFENFAVFALISTLKLQYHRHFYRSFLT